MKPAHMIDQLKSMPPETQAAPEFKRLLARLEAPPPPRFPIEMEETSNIMRDDAARTMKPKVKPRIKMWLLVAVESLAALILLVHLYNYVDVPLAGLTVGGLLDIAVSVILVGLLGFAIYRGLSGRLWQR
jgi:hypothetical protein